MNDAQLIKQLIDEYEGDDLTAYIADELSRMQAIRDELRRIARSRQKLIDDHNNDLENLEAAELDIQRTCPHRRTSWHGDPSGNNDSFVECEDCRATARRAEFLPKL